jgi:DNA polymerase I-like protein with 3'-5' exonuclease and polymerase domains
MLREIAEGIDQHVATGKEIFGGRGERTDWKIFNFRMIYGGTGFSYYMDYKMPDFSLKKWNQIVNGFYEKYYGLKEWHDELVNTVRKNKGWLQNPTGRRFKFLKYPGKDGYDYARPQILNYPVQSFATADIVPLCMAIARKRILKSGINTCICNQVHDSIIYDVPTEEAPHVARIILDVMEEMPKHIQTYYGIDFNTRLGGEAKIGPNWKEMEEYKWKN